MRGTSTAPGARSLAAASLAGASAAATGDATGRSAAREAREGEALADAGAGSGADCAVSLRAIVRSVGALGAGTSADSVRVGAAAASFVRSSEASATCIAG